MRTCWTPRHDSSRCSPCCSRDPPGRLGARLPPRSQRRTIRNDIDRLRELGYPVDATRGATATTASGRGDLPPLLLDDDEAVAVAVGLRAATGIDGIEEISARTLAKLNQVLPLAPALEGRQRSRPPFTQAPENTGSNVADPEIDPGARRGRHRHPRRRMAAIRLPGGAALIEPYRLVNWHRRWYVVGRDPRTARGSPTARLDVAPGADPPRFAPHPLPGEDYTSFVLREVAATGYTVHARITVLAPADEVLSRINATVGIVESIDAETCVLVTGADSFETMAVYIGMLGLEFRVTEPPELVEHLAELAGRYRRSVEVA